MPVLNLQSFNTKIRAATATLPAEETVRAQKKLAIDLATGIIEKSIVDTGLSRGNWHVSFGSPDDLLFGIRAPQEAMQQITTALEALGPFQVVYIQNNVAYVSYLEDGTPKIPAVGMVARTLAELEAGL